MEKSKRLILGVMTGLLICSISIAKAGDKKEHTRPYNGTFGGTFLSTRMDLNDDGVLAVWSTAEISGTLGKRTNQSVAEGVPTGVTPECPGGVSIIDAQSGVGFSASTATFPNGDQIYSRILTRNQCGLGAGKFETVDTTEITGGTGKFEGASGTVEVHSVSQCQAFDANSIPPQCYGSFTGEFTGTITLP
ncbi:MAG: hypothetical protein AB7G75_01045 [Candidatus Binatia bacterium]